MQFYRRKRSDQEHGGADKILNYFQEFVLDASTIRESDVSVSRGNWNDRLEGKTTRQAHGC